VRSPLVRGHSLVPLASEVAQWQSDAGHAHENARESLAREQPFDRLSEFPADPQQDFSATRVRIRVNGLSELPAGSQQDLGSNLTPICTLPHLLSAGEATYDPGLALTATATTTRAPALIVVRSASLPVAAYNCTFVSGM